MRDSRTYTPSNKTIKLYQSTDRRTTTRRIVLIPGLGPAGPPVTEWGLCSEQWQNSLADCTKSSVLCTIEHGVTVDSLFNFKRLVEAGVELQDQLIRLYRAEGVRPLALH